MSNQGDGCLIGESRSPDQPVSPWGFVKNSTVERKYIGLLLRSGVRKLTEDDVELIRKRAQGAIAEV